MNAAPRPGWAVVIGYAVGVGLCFAGTLGVWLQYATSTFNFLSGGALSLGLGIIVGGAFALLRPGVTR